MINTTLNCDVITMVMTGGTHSNSISWSCTKLPSAMSTMENNGRTRGEPQERGEPQQQHLQQRQQASKGQEGLQRQSDEDDTKTPRNWECQRYDGNGNAKGQQECRTNGAGLCRQTSTCSFRASPPCNAPPVTRFPPPLRATARNVYGSSSTNNSRIVTNTPLPSWRGLYFTPPQDSGLIMLATSCQCWPHVSCAMKELLYTLFSNYVLYLTYL